MVQCLGYKHGTGCQRVNRTPQATCWDNYQLCAKCSKDDLTKSYRTQTDQMSVIDGSILA